jgi:hypothetical protein
MSTARRVAATRSCQCRIPERTRDAGAKPDFLAPLRHLIDRQIAEGARTVEDVA